MSPSSKNNARSDKKNARTPKNGQKAPSAKKTPAASSTTGRRLAAVGAGAALVVAVVAAGLAIAKSSGGSGGSDDRAKPAATASPDPQQPLFDEAERMTSRREKGDPLALGKPDAPVVLVEYADYQCSFCGRFTRESQPELIKKYVDEGVLRIEFRNFPIFGDPSQRAARASWAAGRQGRFWQFHDELYAKTRKGDALAEDKLVDMARTAGVGDLDRFRADMKSDAAEEAVKKDQQEGYRLGVSSTPSFLVGGRPLAGAQPMKEFEAAVEQARLAKAARTPQTTEDSGKPKGGPGA
ncbi:MULTISPECIES: DsbA family protein [Streptomyces]|uniref:DsbA family protein n=1 Tax=Streptomyces TaxID=1883 RepID=UPI00163CC58E|nr:MULTISPECIES: DsbA family protein [Streptomyces]MBC2877794.1 DsbA family protein [Streptomyces sp. TYQ1024]UBI38695.1 DsbA family protein [Streptomyces mobaraensis]UKW31276.1 DsbA family protein [Streptomyces sp. TYQ1024]